MKKILTKEILLEQTLRDLKNLSQFELYSFEEKKQYLNCLHEVMKEYKELQDQIIEQNLDQSVLSDNLDIKIKDKLALLKSVLRDI